LGVRVNLSFTEEIALNNGIIINTGFGMNKKKFVEGWAGYLGKSIFRWSNVELF
jgi:hypothetical protein